VFLLFPKERLKVRISLRASIGC